MPVARTRNPELHGPAWFVQAAVIARQFFLEGRSKVEIGDDLRLSRFKVARILDEARDLGLVEVTIRLPALIDADASTALHGHLGISRAIVLAEDTPDDQIRNDLGRLAAGVLTELVNEGDVLGFSCSRSVTATTHSLTSLARCEVVQLTGTLAGSDGETGSVESVRHATVVGGGRAYPIYAPMVLPDEATARSLAGEAAIRQTLDRIDSVTIAMVAVGGWASNLSTVWASARPDERRAARAAGAVGEIGGRLFDEAGRPVSSGIDSRVLGASLDQLHKIPEVVGLAYGDRGVAVRAAATAGLLSTLVCDHDLASRLLALPSVPNDAAGPSDADDPGDRASR